MPLTLDVRPSGVEQEPTKAAAPARPTLSTLTPDDLATLVVNGRRYDQWTSVQVQREYKVTPDSFTLTLAEPGGAQGWGAMPIKPQDRATLYLAGVKACDGYIIKRRVGLGASGHNIVVMGASATCDLVASSAKPGQYRGYTIQAIADGILSAGKFPTKFKLKNPPKAASLPFDNFIVHYGETVIDAIDRLCRMRGLFLSNDTDGNLVGSTMDGKARPVASLTEGVNIKDIDVELSDEAVMAKVFSIGSDKGSDTRSGKKASQVGAVATNPNARPWRVLRTLAEERGTTADMQRRANFELLDSLYTSVECGIVVQGWRRPDGQLWDVTDAINVESPTCFPDNGGRVKLGLKSVVFSQGPGGTLTTLGLCLPTAMGSPPDPNVKGPVPNLLSPAPTDAVSAPKEN